MRVQAYAGLGLVAALAAQTEPAAGDPPAIDWESDLGLARERARQTHRPLLAVFRCEA